ncbi:hypothetical protein AB0O22_12740 [Streptomyces sp. NPDC091204]|uniref:hypothetical protein n=1 Tax=Streptomyces sp. NPDC091204 TaxID=3155299 RepID=UPI0034120654
MFRIVRTTTLRTLTADRDALGHARGEAETATDSAIRAETAAEVLADQLRRAKREADEEFEGMRAILKQAAAERDEARDERDAARKEVEEARAQVLLDAEDRVALRVLLRTARRQDATRVHVLFHRGRFHSVHTTVEGAEAAAEAEGAPRGGWTAHAPGEALPPASEVVWRVQPLTLQQQP